MFKMKLAFSCLIAIFFQMSLCAFTLRPCQSQDEDVLYQLICELAVYEGKDLASLPLTKEKLHRFGFSENPYFRAEVAEDNGGIVGYALYFYTFSANQGHPVLYLEDLYVQPEFRKQGIGTSLIQKLAQYAKENDCCRMEWHVFDWNEGAIAFYDRLGAQLRKDLILVRLQKDAMQSFFTR